MPQAISFAALFGIAFFGTLMSAKAQPSPETPFAKSLSAPELGIPVTDLVLAQAQAAAADAPGTRADSVGAPAASAAPARRTSQRDGGYYSREELERKRDRFQGMQKTGFGLMMGGIAAGGGGLILMINGLANADSHRDSYGNTQTEAGPSFWIGYISFFVAFPPLLTTGIVLNRIGNHKRQTYERMLEETAGHTRLDIGPDSFRLSYSF